MDEPLPLSASATVMTLETLYDFLCRAHEGEDPDLILAELWGNADHWGVRRREE